MVPVTTTANPAVSSAVRNQIVETCGRDLSRAFAAWLLDSRTSADLLAIAARAIQREGAGQDFQTVAILGFAADARVLSERELATLNKGLIRLAGRQPVVSGVPMPFCADAVGILGIALGTDILANPEVTGQVVGWAMRFLKGAYERHCAEDWQRCLFAAADLKLGNPLKLPLPKGAAVADVRLALLPKGLIDYPDRQLQEDAARLLEMPIQEPSSATDCERAALRLAGIELVMRREAEQGHGTDAVRDPISTELQRTSKDDRQSGIYPRPRNRRGRPTKIADELKERALRITGTKARAKILYQCPYPTIQQQRNVVTILKHYRKSRKTVGE